MNDPRVQPDPALVVTKNPAQVSVPVADITRTPDGARDRQLLLGDTVTILNQKDRHALIRSDKDGYCGWVFRTELGPKTQATHRVTARATHIYSEPDFKSPDRLTVSFGSKLTAIGETATFVEIDLGFLPRQHVHTEDTVGTDPSAVAELFHGTPYLWGGNTSFGIDCSGLVQAACLSCGIHCPGDTDQQVSMLGSELPSDALLQRNDVIFWKGHVALVSDAETILHANAGHMATVFEPLKDALARIEAQGDGLPVCFRRLL